MYAAGGIGRAGAGVSAVIDELPIKRTVRAAVATNISLASAPATMDGLTPALGDKYLLFGQTLGQNNGSYVWHGAGLALTRSPEMDQDSEVRSGLIVAISEGTHADKIAFLSTNDPIILGTTALVFTLQSIGAHALGGPDHTTSTLAQLDAKVSDRDLVADAAKLDDIEPLADVTDLANVAAAFVVTAAAAVSDTGAGAGNAGKLLKLDGAGLADGRDLGSDGTKLDLIEPLADVTDIANVAAALGVTAAAAVTDTGAGAGNAGKLAKLDAGGLLDGRDVGADGVKLDTVEAQADVTDQANVTAALGVANAPAVATSAGVGDAGKAVKLDGAGKFADSFVPESSVTQHEDAIDHDALLNYVIAQHRVINDGGTLTTELWSASKISLELAAIAAGLDIKNSVETVADTNIALTGEQTINGVLTSASRIGVVGQTAPAENGIYVTGAGAWARATDMDVSAEVTQGLSFFVGNAGSTKNGNQYILTTANPITLGTTALSFTEVPRIVLGTLAGTAAAGNDARIPTQDENDALAGTGGAPSAANAFVTDDDPRNSDSRAPSGTAGGGLNGSYPNPEVDGMTAGVLTDDTAHGARGGGMQHAVATGATAGFMAAADKSKLDGIEAAADVTDEANVRAALAAASATVGFNEQTLNNIGVSAGLILRMAGTTVGGRHPALRPVSALGYIGSRTVAEINALSPALGDAVVATDAGTPTAGTSDALAAGDVAEFDGTSWQKIIANSGGFPPSNTRLAAGSGVLYSPLTDGVDEGKVCDFGGASLTPSPIVAIVTDDTMLVANIASALHDRAFVWEGAAGWRRIIVSLARIAELLGVTSAVAVAASAGAGDAGKLAKLDGAGKFDGSMIPSGSGGGVQFNRWHPNDAILPSIGPPALTTRNERPVLAFDAASLEGCYFDGIMSQDYDGAATLKIWLHWAANGATTGAVKFNVEFERIGDGVQDLDASGHSMGAADGQTATNTTKATDGHVKITNIPFTNVQADGVQPGEAFRLLVVRDAADAGDTLTVDAQLIGLSLTLG